jgi:hypothetical protein
MPAYKITQYGLVAMELLAFLTGCYRLKTLRLTYWQWFVYYLGFIAVGEMAGLTLLYGLRLPEFSRGWYNYFVIPVEFLFFYWLYYQYFKPGNKKYWPLYGAAIYSLSWLVHIFIFDQVNFWSIPFSYMAGVVTVLLLTIVFFADLVVRNKILNFRLNMMFWVSLGLLVFFLVSSPFLGFRNELYSKYRNIFWLYYYIQFGVNYLMYLFFIIALVWGKPR